MQKIIQVIPNRAGQVNREHIEIGADILNKGGIIALPTDTLYGLAARVEDSRALDKIYEIKGRDLSKPLAIALNSIEDIPMVAKVSDLQMKAAQLLLPGSVTLLFERSETLNPKLNPGIGNIGVRVIDHNLISGICYLVGPIALTSANKSGESSPIQIDDFQELFPSIDCIFDQGVLQRNMNEYDIRYNRLGSTVVDLTTMDQKYFRILRQGMSTNRAISTLLRLGIRQKIDKQLVNS